MGQSIIAVVVGFVLTAVLNLATNAALAAAGVIPSAGPTTDTATLVLVCAYVAAYGILGCYVTARLAPQRPLFHALVLGGVALAMSIPVMIGAWNDTPAWFNVFNLLAIMPYAYVGGKVRERQLAGGTASLA